jgi:hypothetical protein
MVYNCQMAGINSGYSFGNGILSWVISFLIIGLLIAGIYWFVKSANKK